MAEHGTYHMYKKYGCRCDLCRYANAERQRRTRSERSTPPPIQPTVPRAIIDAAACRGHAGDLFFGGEPWQNAAAKAICASCTVAPECLEHAFDAPEDYGVWGGLTPRERNDARKALRRQRRLRRAVTAGSVGQSPRPGYPTTPASGSPTDVEVRWPRHINNAGHHSSGERLA